MKYLLKYLFAAYIYMAVNIAYLIWTFKPYEINFEKCVKKAIENGSICAGLIMFSVATAMVTLAFTILLH